MYICKKNIFIYIYICTYPFYASLHVLKDFYAQINILTVRIISLQYEVEFFRNMIIGLQAMNNVGKIGFQNY
jgi:hypothetical protein